MKRLILCAAAVAGSAVAARAAFTPGDVYAKSYSGDIWKVTQGADLTPENAFANVGHSDLGKMAFSGDLSTMYVANASNGSVYAVTDAGAVSVFATGLSGPFGLLRTNAGRLLVAERDAGEVTDITAGGNFTGAAPFASGLVSVGDLAQTADGRIFAAGWISGDITNITAGGIFTPAAAITSTPSSAYSIVVGPAGDLIVADPFFNQVWSVTTAGVANVIANGRQIYATAYAGDGRLLGAEVEGGGIRDLSAGGNLASAPLVASGSFNSIGAVPAAVPEPAVGLAIAGAGLALARRRGRRGTSGSPKARNGVILQTPWHDHRRRLSADF